MIHHECLYRFGFVLENRAVRAAIAGLAMRQPMCELMHESQQLFLRIQAWAQHNAIAQSPSLD
jgi:hypothetical protein